MKKVLTEEMYSTLVNTHKSVLGTDDYAKYLMCCEYKRHKEDGEWTPWIYMGWYVPTMGNANTYYLKSVKDKLYIMHEWRDGIERYEVTPAVRELWNM